MVKGQPRTGVKARPNNTLLVPDTESGFQSSQEACFPPSYGLVCGLGPRSLHAQDLSVGSAMGGFWEARRRGCDGHKGVGRHVFICLEDICGDPSLMNEFRGNCGMRTFPTGAEFRGCRHPHVFPLFLSRKASCPSSLSGGDISAACTMEAPKR